MPENTGRQPAPFQQFLPTDHACQHSELSGTYCEPDEATPLQIFTGGSQFMSLWKVSSGEGARLYSELRVFTGREGGYHTDLQGRAVEHKQH